MIRRGVLLFARTLALWVASACNEVAPVEGAFVCTGDSECPDQWICERRAGKSEPRCWRPSTGSAMPQGSDGGDFTDTPGRTGGRSFPERDAAPQYACGTWKHVRFTDAIPPNAEPYGSEYDEETKKSGPHFVCRFEHAVHGRSMTLQGKGAFGYGCYAVAPESPTTPASVVSSADFEVLLDTKGCAPMGAFDPTARLLATGFDADGRPTFSCRASTQSPEDPAVTDHVLGRFDPATRQCHFVSADQVHQQEDGIAVLLAP